MSSAAIRVFRFCRRRSLSVVSKSSQAMNASLTDGAVMSGRPFCAAICAMAAHRPSKAAVFSSGTRSPFL